MAQPATPDMQRPNQSWRNGRLLILAWLVLTPALLFAGFQQIFSTHADYDDEGYVMLSLVSYLEGKPLYDETYSQYGPVLFMAQGAFHQWTGLPISHDVVRFKTLAVWWLAASLVMWFVYRQSSSWRLAVVGLLAAFFHLDRLCLEPGHPQELCLLAIVGSLTLATELLRQRESWFRSSLIAGLLGLLIGCTLMVKLNIGVFLFVSCTLLLLACCCPKGRFRILYWLGAGGAIALPLLVSWSQIADGSGLALPLVCSASMLTVVATMHRRPELTPVLPLASCGAFASGVACMVAASCWVALDGGASPAGLWHGLIGQHMGFKESFFTPAPLHIAAIVGAGLFVDAAIRQADHRFIGVLRIGVACLMLFCLCQYLPETRLPLIHGMNDRGAAGLLLGAVGPAMWLLLAPATGLFQQEIDESASSTCWRRLPLCLLAALQPMAAYPTPGTQMAVGTLLLAIGGLLLIHDVVKREHAWLPRTQLAMPALIALLCCTLFVRASFGYQRRNSLASLDLPGAQLLRLPEKKAARIQWLVKTLTAEADTFVFGEHAACSYYFWTRQAPPTGLNPTFWPFLLRHEEQQRVITALDQTRRTAVVHQPFATPLPEDSPLLEYLDQQYQPALQHDTLEVRLPKDRSTSPRPAHNDRASLE